MKISKGKKVKAVAVSMAAVALATTSVVAVGTQTESKAAFYFKRVQIKDCNLKLTETTMPWTGEAVCPEVIVTYDGKELVNGKDYIVDYVDNVDAGVGKAIVKGVGKEFRGEKTLFFTVKGININDECTIKLVGHTVNNNLTYNDELYLYKGDELVDPSNYDVAIVRTKEKCEGINLFDLPLVNHYIITTKYFVQGKGQYEGTRVYEERGVFKMVSSEVFSMVAKLFTGQYGEDDGAATAAVENISEDVEVLEDNVTLIYDNVK